MSAPDVRDGVLEAYERRRARASFRPIALVMLVGLAPIVFFYCYLVVRCSGLASENARLRDACGVKGRP